MRVFIFKLSLVGNFDQFMGLLLKVKFKFRQVYSCRFYLRFQLPKGGLSLVVFIEVEGMAS